MFFCKTQEIDVFGTKGVTRMSRETTLAAFSNLHQGRSRGAEAPHKPLLVLYALSQWLRHGTTVFRFEDIEEPLGALVRDPQFGGVETATPRDPFWFLRNDGVWVVESGDGADITYMGDRPAPRELRAQDARGRFSPAVVADLFASPGLAIELVGRLLCEYFDPANHQVVLERISLWLRR
jgi:putative restriction endonuclease